MPADQPVAGNGAPSEKQTIPQAAADGVPADLTNLALGAGLLLSAFLVFWMGLYLANHVALRALAASFGTFALVWVLYRMRIFHRPHGGLIAAGSVALFAAALPFIERGFLTLDQAAKAKLAGEPGGPGKAEIEPAATLPVPTRQKPAELPPPPTPKAPEDDIVRELIAPAPDPSVGKIIRVTQDAKIELGGRKFLIKSGSQFPFKSLEDGIVTFLANGQEATIQSEVVSFMGKSKETPEEITKLAGAELMRRYPAIRSEGSPENKLYVARVNALKDEMPELFKDPHWPIIIGEQLAAHEGWTRSDATPDNTAAPAETPKAPQPPDLGTPPPPPEAPPIPPEVPQEAPK